MKKEKKKMTRIEKNRIIMKIAGWLMFLTMAAGVLISFIIYFVN